MSIEKALNERLQEEYNKIDEAKVINEIWNFKNMLAEERK